MIQQNTLATPAISMSSFCFTWPNRHAARWFAQDFSCRHYHELLSRFRARYGIVIHGYTLGAKQAHVSGLCPGVKSLQLFLRTVNSGFARLVRQRGRGDVAGVTELFPSPQIVMAEDPRELWNKISQGFGIHAAKLPNEIKWNSFHHYAYAREDSLIDDPQWYTALGGTPEERAGRYVRLVQRVLEDEPRGFWDFMRFKGRSVFPGDPVWLKFKLGEINQAEELARQKRMSKILCLRMS